MEKSSNPSFFIRQASIEDAPSLLSIYRPYVENTAITFEEDPPTLEDFQHRMASTLERYPYLAALADGRIAGYAYAGPFHLRKAYDHAAELSIYIAPPFHHRGLGKALYGQLESILLSQQVFNLYACIAVTKGEDPFLPRTVPFSTETLDSKPWAALKSAGINSAAGMT
ncbi:GNAT family N-acetyltransferase [Dialister succinatiphilus]|uniref:GNAT family N-acetyltransferase n=1 Tax=Dialister succinatiphilus TaxID=487173 RepID=UPI0040263A90